MAGEAKNIKTKIQATKKTSQITKAMNMVSASKLKQATQAIENYISFIDKIEEIVANLVGSGDVKHPLLETRDGDRTCFIIITSERGLAGPFNSNIYKKLTGLIHDDDVVLPFGGRGFNYCKNKYKMLNNKPIILRDDVRFDDIIESLVLVVSKYLNNEFDRVQVIYNHFINTLNQTQEVRQILPVKAKVLEYTSNYHQIYDFEGGIEGLLDKVLPIYIENIVYGIILDSKASEHASRMTAMKNATDNAEDIISSLELMYNRARQASITLELTDIIGGANATN